MTEVAADRELETLGALAEPLRRSLYRWVAAQPRPAGRAAAAAAVGVPRTVAAFHLDKLVDAGLLDVSHGRTTERRGPGSGRPARLYSRSAGEVGVSVPQRSYQLLAGVLAEALEQADADGLLGEAAERAGRRLATDLPAGLLGSANPTSEIDAARAALAGWGYEPYPVDQVLRLRNCPFRGVQQLHPPLVCSINLRLIRSAIAGLGLASVEARMDPRPGECCLVVNSIDNQS
jgi:predicted ArsR family transcriptional regulator